MADGNEVVSIDQLTDVASTSSTVSYGLVKVMTDEQLDEYLNIGGNDSADEPDGIYVVTVQQAVKYLGDISGGGSGGGSDSGGVLLYEGTADPLDYGRYGITGNMSSLNDYSSYVATLRDGAQLTFNEIASSGTDYTGADYICMYDTTEGYALTVGRDYVFGYFFSIAFIGGASATFATVYKFVGYK